MSATTRPLPALLGLAHDALPIIPAVADLVTLVQVECNPLA